MRCTPLGHSLWVLLVSTLLAGCASTSSMDAQRSLPNGAEEASPLSDDAAHFSEKANDELVHGVAERDEMGGWEHQSDGSLNYEARRFQGAYTAPPSLAFDAIITREYVLGDRDTLTEARELLYEEIRDEGARQAGAYVSRKEVLDHTGMLEETLSIMSASVVETRTLDESVTLSPQGRPTLTLSVRVTTDGEALQQQVAALHDTREADERVQRVTMENDMLQRQLQNRTVARLQREDTPPAPSPPSLLSGNGQFSTEIADIDEVVPTLPRRFPRAQIYKLGVIKNESEFRKRVRRFYRLRNQIDEAVSKALHITRIEKQGQGDDATYKVHTQGFDADRFRRLYEDISGVSFPRKGWISQQEIEQMTPLEETNFWVLWESLAISPVGIIVRVRHRLEGDNYPSGLSSYQMLLAPVQLKQDAAGREYVAHLLGITHIAAKTFINRGELPAGVALAFLDIPNHPAVQRDRDDYIFTTVDLFRGAPPVEPQVTLRSLGTMLEPTIAERFQDI